MIVRNKTNSLSLLFAWRGTIFPRVLPAMVILSALSMLLGVVAHYKWFHIPTPPLLGFTLFGIILSIFLGFRNGACYERWWEGRKLWGMLISTQRHLIRDSYILSEKSRNRVLNYVIIYTHLLRDRLRYQSAHQDLFLAYNPTEADSFDVFNSHINPPQYALELIQRELVALNKNAEISDIVYTSLTKHIEVFGLIQAGCDRIASTPLPFAYSVLLHRAIYSFCFMLPFGLEATLGFWTPLMVAWLVYMFLGLDALSSQLEEPFGRQENDLPLDSIVRLVEREILVSQGKEPPPPISAHNFNLM